MRKQSIFEILTRDNPDYQNAFVLDNLHRAFKERWVNTPGESVSPDSGLSSKGESMFIDTMRGLGWSFESTSRAMSLLEQKEGNDVFRLLWLWNGHGRQTFTTSESFAHALSITTLPDVCISETKPPYVFSFLDLRNPDGSPWSFLCDVPVAKPIGVGIFVTDDEMSLHVLCEEVQNDSKRLELFFSSVTFKGSLSDMEIGKLYQPTDGEEDFTAGFEVEWKALHKKVAVVVANLLLYITCENRAEIITQGQSLEEVKVRYRMDQALSKRGKKRKKALAKLSRDLRKPHVTIIDPYKDRVQGQGGGGSGPDGDPNYYRGHWVRGHFKHYWRGPRDSEDRKRVRRWIEPFLRGDLNNMVERNHYHIKSK